MHCQHRVTWCRLGTHWRPFSLRSVAPRRQDLSRRLQPLSPGDFKLLTGELETWRKQERDKIKAAGLAPAQEQVGAAAAGKVVVGMGIALGTWLAGQTLVG
jgi:hypothetical protein